MRYIHASLAFLLVFGVGAAVADEHGEHPAVVIDTDMGLDDAVALAVALQNPDVDIVAIVACDGVAGGDQGTTLLGRMLDYFNRPDIPLFAPCAGSQNHVAPPFRPFAEQAISDALPDAARHGHRPFAPDAYAGNRKPIVIALGPLTNVAAALSARPALKDGIEKVVLPGSADAKQNWNLSYDEAAWNEVRASGVRLEFVVTSPELRKPDAWRSGKLQISQGTSVGEVLVSRLLEDPKRREHYATHWPGFSDELAVLRCVSPEFFVGQAEADAGPRGAAPLFSPRKGADVLSLFTLCMGEGRQHRDPVVFADRPWPEEMLQPDLRSRAAGIIAKNGQTEWSIQLVTNELHDHLGAYSIIGAKMGLRAAELQNAPLHAMKVTSHSAAEPPVSCLNDGVIVASGSSPGRGLFSHVPGPEGSTKVVFSFNGRDIGMALKPEYGRKIAAEVGRLHKEYGLQRREYWDGVRGLALDIWENWHRRDLFTVESKPTAGLQQSREAASD